VYQHGLVGKAQALREAVRHGLRPPFDRFPCLEPARAAKADRRVLALAVPLNDDVTRTMLTAMAVI
jgi:hypothetical protein